VTPRSRGLPLDAVAWTLAALAIAALPHLLAMPVWPGLIFAGLLGWRLTAAQRGWRPPPRALRILITLAILVLVVVTAGGWSRRAATTLLCLMMAAKLMEMFSARDLRMVASICFFIMAAQFLFNERLAYLIYLGAGSIAATAALDRIHRIHAAVIDAPVRGRAGVIEQLRTAGWMLLLALPIAATLFVLFPRLAQPLWGLPEQAIDGRTGISDELTAGSITNLFLNDDPAFRVEFDEAPPAVEQRYWRGPVLSVLDGKTWRRAREVGEREQPVNPASGPGWRYRVQMEPHERRWLFTLDHPVSGPEDATLTAQRELLARNPVTTLTQFNAVSRTGPLSRVDLSLSSRQLHLDLPAERNPRTREFAGQLRRRHSDDVALVSAVLEWFNEEPFYYSLQSPPLGRDSADEFLFDLRTGYCEYYASAFAVLMRAAGIPARVVVGYQGGHWQAGGGYLLVRQSDAHAWNEVWIEDTGWVRVDPTASVAPSRVNQGARSAIGRPRHVLDLDWLRDLRNRYDRLQHAWNRWILGFDAERQQRLLERLGLPDAGSGTLALLMIVALALVIAPIALVLRRRGRRRPQGPAETAWAGLLARLARKGVIRQPGETPLEFCNRVGDRVHGKAPGPSLIDLGAIYSAIHYGPASAFEIERFVRQARSYRPRLNRR
jgi:transglutaminase-like putative cysteine protease